MDKSYVRLVMKQSVSEKGGQGYELEVKIVKGDTPDEVHQLGIQAQEVATKLLKTRLT